MSAFGDDRQQDFEFKDASWLSRLRASTLALIPARDLVESKSSSGSTVHVLGASLVEVLNVCADEPFAREPASAKCSGTLIAPDLVLTAGHCMRELACADVRFVFDYAMQSAAALETIRAADVFACNSVLVESIGERDFAIVRLDRPARTRDVAKVRLFSTPVARGESLLMASHPSGLPRKISSLAKVTDPRGGASDYFLSDLFSFPGSSGAGVFLRGSGELVGSVIGGLAGTGYYEQLAGQQCVHFRPASDRGQQPIHVNYAAAAIAELCKKNPVAELCPCGNGTCDGSVGETSRTCSADCGSACGDTACNGSETGNSCYSDCGSCGNGICERYEAARLTCCDDCGCPGAYACSNGVCLPELGNANADGSIDAADVRALSAAAAGDHVAPFSLGAADVNCDGRVSQDDALLLRKHLAGNPLHLPGQRVRSVSVGSRHTCVLLGSGQVRCWGDNKKGQLGQSVVAARVGVGTSKPIAFGSRATALAAGGEHTCVLLEDATVHCWGAGSAGQLGYGNPDDRADAASVPAVSLGGPAIAIAAGSEHTCAILVGGRVTCWGDNHAGQLGLGHTRNVGDDQAPADAGRVDLGGLEVRELALGTTHTCALGKGGEVYCWGANHVGELGLGHTSGIGDDEPPVSSGSVQLGAAAAHVAVGALNSCAVLVTGDLRCWGDDSRGQLGDGRRRRLGDRTSPSSVDPVAAGGPIADVAVGTARVCAKYVDGRLRCWGNNSQGQLGLGTTSVHGVNDLPSKLPPVALGSKVDRVSTRGDHTCALLEDESLRCWGDNSAQQLGALRLDDIGDDETPEFAGRVPLFGSDRSEWSFVDRLGLSPRLLLRDASPVQRGGVAVQLKLPSGPLSSALRAVYQLSSVAPPVSTSSRDLVVSNETTSFTRIVNSPFSNPDLALLEFRFPSETAATLFSGRAPNAGSASADFDQLATRDRSRDYSSQDARGVNAWFAAKRIQILDAADSVVYGWVRRDEERKPPSAN